MAKSSETSRIDEEEFEDTVTKTVESISSSFDITSSQHPTTIIDRKESKPFNSRNSTGIMSATTTVNPGSDYTDNYPKSPSIHDEKQFSP